MKKLLLFLSFAISLNFYGQYEAEHWYFGDNAGLDFVAGGAPVLEPGSQIETEEGCSSISNACGDLLLYTDGITVWNANHQIMLNGTNLLGDPSSTQSGIVVPKPGDNSKYYVFTVDDGFSAPSSEGLCYSEVDMNLDGGLGGVVSTKKNINLVTHAGEKVTAVVNEDGSAVWVITFAPNSSSTTAPYAANGSVFNTFYAFKITSAGVQSTATVSTLALNVDGGVGYMKVSPAGDKIAVANMYDNSAYLLDFDSATGAVSNPVVLPLTYPANEPYGVEFSPDSSKLYISDKNNRVTQFDLHNNNAMTVLSTRSNYRSALQLGLDGKIYQTYTRDYGLGSHQMSVIENPNAAGAACNYRYRYINLGSGMTAHQGLPPFIQSFFIQVAVPDVTAEFTNQMEVESNEEITSVDWDFGDGTTTTTFPDNPPDNTHAYANHVYMTPGTYTITAILHLAIGCDTVVTKDVTIPPILDTDLTSLCTSNPSGIQNTDLHDYDVIINDFLTHATNYEVHYYSSDSDALSNQNEITGLYTNTTQNDKIFYAITDLDTDVTTYGLFYLKVSPNPQLQPVASYDICDIDTDGFAEFDLTSKEAEILNTYTNPPYETTYFSSQNDAETATNEIVDPQSYTNINPAHETIWYRVENIDTGCYSVSSFDLNVYPLITINMDDTYLFCVGSNVQIDAPAGFVAYDWSNGETTASITVDTPGTYTLTVTNAEGCTQSKNVEVIASDVAVINHIKVADFDPALQNTITVDASGIGDYEYSLDGVTYQDENTFTSVLPGTYIVYVSDKNACGIVQETVDVLGASPVFTPNGDGINDFWQILNVQKRPGTQVYIYDRLGKLLGVVSDTSQGWDGTFNGKALPADEYWFVVHIPQSNHSVRTIKGHFSLIR